MAAYSDAIRVASPTMSMVADLIDGIANNGGWLSPGDTWTYASSTTFTVSGDVRAKFPRGAKLKCTNSSTKYFYAVSASYSAPNTTVTVTGGSDYSLSNTTISANYIGYGSSADGFPHAFNWSPTLTGFSANPTNVVYRFTLNGGVCLINVRQGLTGTSNATGFSITLPITAATIASVYWGTSVWVATNNSAVLTTPANAYIASGASTVVLDKDFAGALWTASGGKAASFQLSYEVA